MCIARTLSMSAAMSWAQALAREALGDSRR